jgi:carboxyl-terminal processing protease
VINALKPYMNVTLIGASSFGKPVGFFGIEIDQYTVYMSNFLTVNANDEGAYYSGFKPDIPAKDDVTHDFGDPEESCLQAVLTLIAPGTEKPNARLRLRDGSTINAAELNTRHLGEERDFQGMIENRKAPGY